MNLVCAGESDKIYPKYCYLLLVFYIQIGDSFKISKDLSSEEAGSLLLSLLLITSAWTFGREKDYYVKYNDKLNCVLRLQKDHLLHRDGLYFLMTRKNILPGS
jgi:hypothetical protein